MLYLRVSPSGYQTDFQFNLSLMLFINLIKHTHTKKLLTKIIHIQTKLNSTKSTKCTMALPYFCMVLFELILNTVQIIQLHCIWYIKSTVIWYYRITAPQHFNTVTCHVISNNIMPWSYPLTSNIYRKLSMRSSMILTSCSPFPSVWNRLGANSRDKFLVHIWFRSAHFCTLKRGRDSV